MANLDAILMFKKWRLILSQTDNAAAAGFVFVIGVVFRHRNACGKQLTFGTSSHRVWPRNHIDFAVGQRGGRQEGLPVTSRFELKIL